jgi:hypothetical protein
MWSYNQTELYHYGVPGMRWGQRKAGIMPEKTKPGEKPRKPWEIKKPDPWNEKVPDPLKNTKDYVKKRKEEIKERNEIRKAKGADKVFKILKSIGKSIVEIGNAGKTNH